MRRLNHGLVLLIAAGLGLSCASVQALEFEFGDELSFSLNNRLSTGVAIRMQERNPGLIGKLNIPGQSNLCAPDNCISLSNDPEPNQRLVNAPGGFSAVNGDDGNLNYDRHDIVAATTKLNTDFKVKWGENWLGRVRALAFYDPVNAGFDETHTDLRYQSASSRRSSAIERKFAKGINLLDAYVQYAFEFDGRSAAISVGNQTVRWGESTLVAINSLSEINPPNQALLRMPGVEISELFQPVPVALFSTDIVDGVSAEIFYQFGWKEATPDPRGSFFADNDFIGPPGTPAYITLGQFGEDPNRNSGSSLGSPLDALSSTTNTVYIGEPNKPSHGGQYGLRLNYFADWLNGGTEMGFYFLNYHSRLPYGTVVATNDSCTRDANNLATSFLACNGFNGNLPHLTGPGLEPLPIDTLRVYLDYPEDIQMYGFSFNTNIGKLSLAGEYSFRPNVPLQVHLTDVIFAGLQPAFPAEGFAIDPTGLAAIITGTATALNLNPSQLAAQFPGLAGDVLLLSQASFPGAQQAVPSYLAMYRGLGRINANQLITGYERMQVGQFDLTAILAFSQNPFGADQIIQISEVGGTHVLNMPALDQLQFEGAGLYRTHYSPGADGTGNGGVPPYPTTLNPTQQTTGFADDFAWGLRSITRFEYNDVIFGWSLLPSITMAWDVQGIAPSPIQNFVEGRKEFSVGTDINITQSFAARVIYQWFTGGGRENTRKDRDNLAMSLAYTF